MLTNIKIEMCEIGFGQVEKTYIAFPCIILQPSDADHNNVSIQKSMKKNQTLITNPESGCMNKAPTPSMPTKFKS